MAYAKVKKYKSGYWGNLKLVEIIEEKTIRSVQICQGDGIGRHARLKIWWLHGRVGSSPIPGKWWYFEVKD